MQTITKRVTLDTKRVLGEDIVEEDIQIPETSKAMRRARSTCLSNIKCTCVLDVAALHVCNVLAPCVKIANDLNCHIYYLRKS